MDVDTFFKVALVVSVVMSVIGINLILKDGR